MKEITTKNIRVIWKRLQPGDYFKYSPNLLWTDIESRAREFNLEVKNAGGFIGIVIKRIERKKKKEEIKCFPS
jgi:hypothetical protein